MMIMMMWCGGAAVRGMEGQRVGSVDVDGDADVEKESRPR